VSSKRYPSEKSRVGYSGEGENSATEDVTVPSVSINHWGSGRPAAHRWSECVPVHGDPRPPSPPQEFPDVVERVQVNFLTCKLDLLTFLLISWVTIAVSNTGTLDWLLMGSVMPVTRFPHCLFTTLILVSISFVQ
jgi:hypothetical protein